MKCDRCKRDVEEVCSGDHCRDCHISISWEQCVGESAMSETELRAMNMQRMEQVWPNEVALADAYMRGDVWRR